MVPGKLPNTSRPEVCHFFSTAWRTDEDASRAWFALCQGIKGCEYLASAPGREPYELIPTTQTVSRALGYLLNAPGWESWTKLRQFTDFINRTLDTELTVLEKIDVQKSAVSEDKKFRELAEFRARRSPVSLEIALHAAHRTATCTYRRLETHTAVSDPTARQSLLSSWKAGDLADWSGPYTALILGDSLLESLRSVAPEPPQAIHALLSARWGPDRMTWQPLERPGHTAALLETDFYAECRRGAQLVVTGARVAADLADRQLAWKAAEFAASEAGMEDPDVGMGYLDKEAFAVAVEPFVEIGRDAGLPEHEMWEEARKVLEGRGWSLGDLVKKGKMRWLRGRRSRL